MIEVFQFLTQICYLTSIICLIDPRYHTYQETIQELDSIATQYPAITRLDTIGVSTRDSLPIIAIKISDNPGLEEDEPAILYNGIHHADELLGAEVCLYLINDLVSKYSFDSATTYWINETEIWVVPILNPEGHNVVMTELDTIWRKNKRDNNNNGVFDPDSDGVDLNRNYDFNWALGGSPDPISENYRGPTPFSENETQAIRDLALDRHFLFDICYHCVRTGQGELVYYPWRWGTQFCVDYPFIKKVVDTLASKIINDQGNGTYVPMYGYATEGTARNWLYGVCGTFAYTIEVSRSCYPPGYLVDSICFRNLPGAYYLLERTFGSSITGKITDSVTYLPLGAEVRIVDYYDSTLLPRLSDSIYGRYRRVVNPGTYKLEFIKNGYKIAIFDSILVQPGIPTVLNVRLEPLAIEEETKVKKQEVRLEIYPNPFRENTYIKFQIPSLIKSGTKSFTPLDFKYSTGQVNPESKFSLNIYDATGRLIRQWDYQTMRLLDQIIWSGDDNSGKKLPAGIYFVELKIDKFTEVKKVILLR